VTHSEAESATMVDVYGSGDHLPKDGEAAPARGVASSLSRSTDSSRASWNYNCHEGSYRWCESTYTANKPVAAVAYDSRCETSPFVHRLTAPAQTPSCALLESWPTR
jgi:hypothetical protein